jgi:hypothetical protein
MELGIMIPLGVFAFVVVVVALSATVKIHDLETETHYRLGYEEVEHRRKMQELEKELALLRQRR